MTDVRTISFKSVGKRVTDEDSSTASPFENIPLGIRLPLKLGQGNDGLLAMNFSIGDQIKQNLKNLLLTNFGERIGLYSFGANLKSLTLELSSGDFDNELASRIQNAVSKWMPAVNLIDMQRFDIKIQDGDSVAKIKTRIFYSVPLANIKRDAIDLIFYIAA